MCYSALVKQHLNELRRHFGAEIDWEMFKDIFFDRIENSSIKISRGLEENFSDPQNESAENIKESINAYRRKMVPQWQTELKKQRERLDVAVRKLETKPALKTAQKEKGIAERQIATLEGWLKNLYRQDKKDSDLRIYPKGYAPVIVQDADRRWIRPMRYLCRPAGMPVNFDSKYKGAYNARRDNLEGFWKRLYGKQHALMVVTEFWENVDLHRYEKRELRPDEEVSNLQLHFQPRPRIEMLVACLWDHWSAAGHSDLYSFSAITDDPPPEIAEAGHDRCIIPIQEQNVAEWLAPGQSTKARLGEILSDKPMPYYEHRIAA